MACNALLVTPPPPTHLCLNLCPSTLSRNAFADTSAILPQNICPNATYSLLLLLVTVATLVTKVENIYISTPCERPTTEQPTGYAW